MLPRLAVGLVLLGTVSLAACSDSDTNAAKEQAQTAIATAKANAPNSQDVQNAASNVQKDVKDAWTSLNVDRDRLVDRIQARNDPEAKKELLDNCRSAQEKIAKNDSARGKDVNDLCDKIRDTDINSRDAWNQIKDQMNKLNQEFGS
jgi:hypothetical protein